MKRGWRILLYTFFLLFLLVCGFMAGMYIGGRFFLPPGSGLAGAAIVIAYGLLGAVIALVLGALAIRWLPFRALAGIALPVSLAGAFFTVVMVRGYLHARSEQQAHLAEAYENLNRFRMTLSYEQGETPPPFQRMAIDWGERGYRVTTTDTPPRTCRAGLSGEEAVALLTALREVEGLVYRQGDPCADISGDVLRRLEWFIPEAMPPDSQGKHAISAACAARFPALDRPFDVAAGILRRGDHPKTCS